MFWTKNKDNKKPGTTLIGISIDGIAALGTDYTEEKADGDEIGVVESFDGGLIGFTGPRDGEEFLQKSLEILAGAEDHSEVISEISKLWEEDASESAKLAILCEAGDCIVIEKGVAKPVDSKVIALGPGEEYALAAIRAVLSQSEITETPREIVAKAFKVASGVCVLVNPEAKIICTDGDNE